MTRHRHRYNSSGPIPSCFRPPSPHPEDLTTTTTTTAITTAPPPPQPQSSPPLPSTPSTPNLTTSIYHTRLGIFALTWSRTILGGRSLRLHLFPNTTTTSSSHNHRSVSLPTQQSRSLPSPSSASSPSTSTSSNPSSSFHLTLKPYLFWNKQGSKKLHSPTTTTSATPAATVYWDFSRAKFGSSPEPESGYYIAVLTPHDGRIALLLGDSDHKAVARTKSVSKSGLNQSLVVRREHVVQGGKRQHRTRVEFGGKSREITIECGDDGESGGTDVVADPGLCIAVDGRVVVSVKHLKWKFRGSERVLIDGKHPVQISWDVHNWLFSDDLEGGGVGVGGGGIGVGLDETTTSNGGGSYGLFTFRFERRPDETDRDVAIEEEEKERVYWSEELSGLEENRRMSRKSHHHKKGMRSGGLLLGGSGLLMGGMRNKQKTRSCSSSSVSSASSSACGSVLEWESVEESELKGGDGPTAFSLLVYAWKS